MGGGGDIGTTARDEQVRNKKLVQSGLTQLQSIFYGGKTGANPLTSFNNFKWGQTYYDPSGNPVSYARPSKDLPEPYRQLNSLIIDKIKSLIGSAQLFTGTQTNKGFDPAFYSGIEKRYQDYALPELNKQYLQNSKALQYKFANQGLTGGSANRLTQDTLLQEANKQKQGIANTAYGQSLDTQQRIADEYARLTGFLEASADPGAATQQALQSATRFSQPSPIPVIGGLFNDWANTYLGQRSNQLYRQFYDSMNTQGTPRPNDAIASQPVGGTTQ